MTYFNAPRKLAYFANMARCGVPEKARTRRALLLLNTERIETETDKDLADMERNRALDIVEATAIDIDIPTEEAVFDYMDYREFIAEATAAFLQ